MMKSIISQFANPTGILGHLVGTIMAYENRERNAWAVSLLDVQPSDHLLEIGFGPGLAIQQMAHLASSGFVAGIDQSAVMVQQASKRNKLDIQAGRVELKQGSVNQLPYADRTFHKILVANSLHHWPDRQAGLHQIKRVLKLGGHLYVVEQPRTTATAAMLTELSGSLMSQLAECGFREIRYAMKAMKPTATVAAIGTN